MFAGESALYEDDVDIVADKLANHEANHNNPVRIQIAFVQPLPFHVLALCLPILGLFFLYEVERADLPMFLVFDLRVAIISGFGFKDRPWNKAGRFLETDKSETKVRSVAEN